MPSIREGWGELFVEPVSTSQQFWAIIDEIQNDKSNFWYNRNSLLDAYHEGRVYRMTVEENDFMFERRAYNDPIFCRTYYDEHIFYTLPAFCTWKRGEDNVCEMIWTHSRARRLGIGRAFVEQLEIVRADRPIEDAKPFWDAVLTEQD